eukprot:CAMPEP_0194257512 /NCGR_PEP_ID=MMETSP0158-20130606/39215_1 /TAXON_ID=33649 /ORGANISM="Thalassionema nitzschioides, Strain L26-B" /LENGTH=87 /DNA_ID=CAMNT_0038996575 /DNA_START=261 /DNA_END=522 /DNA_ORIENTATION=+
MAVRTDQAFIPRRAFFALSGFSAAFIEVAIEPVDAFDALIEPFDAIDDIEDGMWPTLRRSFVSRRIFDDASFAEILREYPFRGDSLT